ncbi:MAG TPA: DUF4255 domain-containing protein [Methanotrichaceae archaeon]|nr:DUF4255 domain-containing protein [Methanotrichaceae archaeon]
MSNWLSIATVSATLRNILTAGVQQDPDLVGTVVTTQPPDKARANISGNQINLFLYNVTQNAALRNTGLPGQLRPGESGIQPLALDLHYLITAYGNDNDDILGCRILGKAVSVLNDHPILSADEISNSLTGNDLGNQIDRIRITPHAISVEAMSQLWMIFQTQYRISVGYQVGVVMIDSTAPAKIPPPVLNRGKDGRGAKATTGLSAVLQGIVLPFNLPSVQVGDEIIIQNLDIDAEVHFLNRHVHPIDGSSDIEEVVKKPALNSAHGNIRIKLDDPSEWSAGPYTVFAVIPRGEDPSIATNELPLSVAPKITLPTRSASPGDIDLSLTVNPEVLSGQKVYLLFGSRQILWDPNPRPKAADTLLFTIKNVGIGTYLVRLRVDGVDSMPFNLSSEPLSFDDQQKVVVS